MQQGALPDLRVDQRRGFSSYQVGLHPTSGRSILRPPSSVPRVIPIRTSLAVKDLAACAFRQAEDTSGPEETKPPENDVEHSPEKHGFRQPIAERISVNQPVGCETRSFNTPAKSTTDLAPSDSQHPVGDHIAPPLLSAPLSLETINIQSSGTEGGVDVLRDSTNARIRDMRVYNAGRNIKFGMDDAEFERRLREFFGPESLPAILGFSSTNGLVLTDALDKTVVLPWALVPTYDHLASQLLLLFKNRVGERQVSEGRFSIARAGGSGGGEVIGPDDWEIFIGGRQRVVMSMLMEQTLKSKDFERTCPKCGPTKLGTLEDNGWRICRRCELRFIIASEREYKDRVEKGEANEEAYFRHVRKMEREQAKEKEPPAAQEPDGSDGSDDSDVDYGVEVDYYGRGYGGVYADGSDDSDFDDYTGVEPPKRRLSLTAPCWDAPHDDIQPWRAHQQDAVPVRHPGSSRFQEVGSDELHTENPPRMHAGSSTTMDSAPKRRFKIPSFGKWKLRGQGL